MLQRLLILSLVVAGSLLCGEWTLACNIPVFRYALERWRPDPYEAVLFHEGPLTPELMHIFKELRAAGDNAKLPANLEVRTVDVTGEVDPEMKKLWKAQRDATLPWLIVRYPHSGEKDPLAWAGTPTIEMVKAIVDSPVRKDISRRLLKGDSVVWLLIETGDKKKDDATAELLQTELKKLEKSLKLPTEDDPANDGKAAVQLLSKVSLKIAFPVVRVSRTDPAEKFLLAMLLNIDEEVARRKDEPVMIPIFGRGRGLDAFVGKGIHADTIEPAAGFLCGACSCIVKRQNPGVDLLFAADWESILEEGAPPDPVTRPGVSVAIPPGPTTSTLPPGSPSAERKTAPDALPASTSQSQSLGFLDHLNYAWLAVIAFTFLLGIAGACAGRCGKSGGGAAP